MQEKCANGSGRRKLRIPAYFGGDDHSASRRDDVRKRWPVKTLSGRWKGNFCYIPKLNEYNAPLRRNVTIEDVGGAGLYLLSDLSLGVTGGTHHVDAGYHVVGMKQEDAPDIALSWHLEDARRTRKSTSV
jgi:hypothetical protein